MDTYLLLRNNKQSGPFSLQQLVNLGLKPYDLVWVEGKSAAWRYPSEVDVLKNYAPSTEEQPYDRFYKKQEEKKPEVKSVEEVVSKPSEAINTTVEEKHQQDAPVVSTETRTPEPRKVFVSMPGNGSIKHPPRVTTTTAPVAQAKPVIREEKTEPVKVENKPVVNTQKIIEPTIHEKKPVKDEPVLNEKYSESLEDIKRRYTETYLNRKKRSGWTSTHTSIAQVFGGAIFFCLLVVFVYKNFSGDESSQLSRTTVIQPKKKEVNNNDIQTATNDPAAVPAVNKETTKPKERKQQAVKNDFENLDESVATPPVSENNEENVNSTDYSILVSTPEKKAELPKAEEVKPKTRPVNINRLVSVRANNYKQRAFGGVMNLELTVENDSKFELDRVIVELQYLKPSEQPIKTDRVVFSSIGAGDSKTLRIPDYLRGVKISYRVLDIESAQYDRQTAGL